MIKSIIFSLPSILLRPSTIRSLSISQRFLSDEIYNKNVQLQLQQLAKKEKDSMTYKEMIDERTKRWKEKYEIYYGKERDLVNFPLLLQQDYRPKVRLLIIPDEWFHALYNKTGVTGPYMFFWGGLIFMLQKEYLIYDHDLLEVPAMIFALFVMHRSLGPFITEQAKKIMDKKTWSVALRPKETFAKVAHRQIALATENKAKNSVVLDLAQGAKENVGLQLECAYRTRVARVHKAVKSRLDYQVELEVSKLRYQKQHMIEWIVGSVIKDFTGQQEKAALGQCISDLRALAQKTRAAVA